MIGDTLLLQVAAVTDIAPGLRHLRLVAADGGKLPPAAAGAHVQLVLEGAARTWRNAYSLVSRPGARDAWEIIVRRVPTSRGGSAFIHEQLKAGDRLVAGWPGNLFAPVRIARHHLMIAGGIGITPFLSYLAEFGFTGAERPARVLPRNEKDVFAPGWPAARPSPSTGTPTATASTSRPCSPPAGRHPPLRVRPGGHERRGDGRRRRRLAASHVHCEHFGSALSGGEAFRAFLARSGIEVEVAEDESLLDAIERAGVAAPCLCRGGACGVCATPLLEGEAEHRDHFLSAAERAAGRLIMPCVSRARAGRLVLDQ
jgi:ferredoxin-NADP reductase